MIRLLIADDHTIMLEGLKRILDGIDDIQVIGEAIDGHDTITKLRSLELDTLLLDLSMPGRSGVDLIHQVRSEFPKLPILILTMHEEEQYAVRAIRAGAKEYLPLPPDPELIAAVLAAVADESHQMIFEDEATGRVISMADQVAGSEASILITGEWMLRAAGIAVFASLFGSCYPALRASKQDAIEALAYE